MTLTVAKEVKPATYEIAVVLQRRDVDGQAGVLRQDSSDSCGCRALPPSLSMFFRPTGTGTRCRGQWLPFLQL